MLFATVGSTLLPFIDNSVNYLRAEDGMGIYFSTDDEHQTTSVAFAFQTGEIWSVDTTLLAYQKDVPFLEDLYADRFQKYAHLLAGLGLEPPYHWIAGVTGVKDRRFQVPLPPGRAQIMGLRGPQFLSNNILEQGDYDGQQTPTNALLPFFNLIFDKCGVPRPDHLPR